MRYLLPLVVAASGFWANGAFSQTENNIVIDQELANLGSNLSFLQESFGSQLLPMSTDDTIRAFCSTGTQRPNAIVLSRRLTEDEAGNCGPDGVVETFAPYVGYSYLRRDQSTEPSISFYRGLVGREFQRDGYFIEDDDLWNFLVNRPSILDTLKTSAPETCVSGNSFACRDGYKCCKGTCIENEKECK